MAAPSFAGPARVAFVGAGNIARYHFDALAALGDTVAVVGVCDVDRTARKSAKDRLGCQAFTDFRRMFDKVRPHAVFVVVPPFAHGEVELEALGRGLHLFVEKPVTRDLDTALRVRDAVEAADVFTSVGYHWRYSRFTRTVEQFLGRKRIAAASGHWAGTFPGVEWWRQRDKSGGQMVEQTTHLFDLCRHYLGEAKRVYARQTHIAEAMPKGSDVAAASVAVVEFESGAIAQLTSACTLPEVYRVELSLFTEGGVAEIGQRKLRLLEKGKVTEYTDPGQPYLEEDRAFIQAVRTGDASNVLAPYADAVKTLRLTLAALESAETGRVIDLSTRP